MMPVFADDSLEDDLWGYVFNNPAFEYTDRRDKFGMTDTVAALGAAYGTAKSGIGIAGVGTFRPDLIMKAWR